MSIESVMFSFRDRMTQLLNDRAARALQHEIDYRACCTVPKLTESLSITPTEMNVEMQTMVSRGYVTVHEETVFPTWKTLIKHAAFQKLTPAEASAIIAKLKAPSTGG
jgi:hypothetical protein